MTRVLLAALVPASMLIANATLLLIQVLLPRFVAPAQYAHFAVQLAIGQFCASLCFEWLRFSVIRFAVGADAGAMAQRRVVLLRGYLAIAAALVAVAAALGIAGALLPVLLPAAAIAVYAPSQGSFEGRQALARAEGDNRRFAIGWLVRSLLSLAGSLGLALATGDGGLAFLGFALSYPLTLLLFEARALPRLRGAARGETGGQLAFLAGYGVFAAASVVISTFLMAAVRVIATRLLPVGEAGALILSLDLAQKALTVLGLAVNVVLLQQSIRSAEFDSADRHRAQLGRQLSIPFALMTPAAVGFWLIQPSFAAIAVPAGYRAVYLANIGWATVAAWLLALRLFSVDTLFMAAGRSTMAVVGPLVSIVATLIGIGALAALLGVSGTAVCAGLAFGIGAGLAVALTAAQRLTRFAFPLRDMALAIALTLPMAIVLVALPGHAGPVHLLAQLGAAGIVYGGGAWAADLCGLRGSIRPRRAAIA